MTILQNEYARQAVVFDADYRRGSIADRSPYKAAATVTAGVDWVRGPLGYAMRCIGTGRISYEDNAANRLVASDSTFIVLGMFSSSLNLGSARFICKRDGSANAYELYSASATQFVPSYGGGAYTITTGAYFGSNLLVISNTNTGTPRAYVNGSYAGAGALNAVAVPASTAPLVIGNYYTGATPLRMPLYRVIILNRALPPQDIAQLYRELSQERYPLRAYSFGQRISAPKDPPGVAALLKTDFTTRLADGRLADLSGNGWHGIVKPGFVAGPGMCGNSLVANSASRTYVDFGDVTPINGASKMTFIWHGKRGDWSDTGIVFDKGNTVASRMHLYCSGVVVGFFNGAVSLSKNVALNGNGLLSLVFDGSLADTQKTSLIVDNRPALKGEASGMSSTLPNNTGKSFQIGRVGWPGDDWSGGGVAFCPMQQNDFFAIYNAALTPEQVEYVRKQIAGRCTFSLDMQRVPVSLANMVGPCEVPNTPFRLQSGGTWKVSEDAQGKRWFESVAGTYNPIYTPSSQAYGTWVYRIKTGTSGTDFVVPISDKVSFNTSPRNAYAVSFGASNKIYLTYYYTGSSTVLFTSSTTYAASTEYDLAVTRGSNGSFSIYLRGGAYPQWTLLLASSGSNPVTENTYKTCAYSLFVSADGATAAKFSQPRFFAGVLTADMLREKCP